MAVKGSQGDTEEEKNEQKKSQSFHCPRLRNGVIILRRRGIAKSGRRFRILYVRMAFARQYPGFPGGMK
jgi:hypothetical protein